MGNNVSYEKIKDDSQSTKTDKLDETKIILNNNNFCFETKVLHINKYKNYLEIQCNPSPLPVYEGANGSLMIKNDNPNYIQLYNNIEINGIYCFICDRVIYTETVYILEMNPKRKHMISGKLKGFLNIKKEFNSLGDYVEVMIETEKCTHRLLTKQQTSETMEIGKTYTLYYEMNWAKNLFLITHFEIL
jgi:hypothetical protein